ncbi:Uncharacterized protein FWK35_00025004 [Aphis craccivora]|uniref:Uncharacterized protein n=1 Tax=Aphis craccivora TaxID=307492 RepID=A0A6G0Z9C2_APHCR|nr:Uncharacterized protein FWK35_00025004 [Aphis craccivora]
MDMILELINTCISYIILWDVEVNSYEIQSQTKYNSSEFSSSDINSSCHRLFLGGVLFTYLISSSFDLTVTFIVYTLGNYLLTHICNIIHIKVKIIIYWHIESRFNVVDLTLIDKGGNHLYMLTADPCHYGILCTLSMAYKNIRSDIFIQLQVTH